MPQHLVTGKAKYVIRCAAGHERVAYYTFESETIEDVAADLNVDEAAIRRVALGRKPEAQNIVDNPQTGNTVEIVWVEGPVTALA